MIKFQGNPSIEYFIVHHTAVSRRIQPLQLTAVNNHHRDKEWIPGWKQPHASLMGWWVGYNFFVEVSGQRTQTRLVGEETIAQKGMNCDVPERCLGMSNCIAGDLRIEKPLQVQEDATILNLAEAMKTFPKIEITQHLNVQPGRTCAALPDEMLQEWYQEAQRLQNPLNQVPNPTTDPQGVLEARLRVVTAERDRYQKTAEDSMRLSANLLELLSKKHGKYITRSSKL